MWVQKAQARTSTHWSTRRHAHSRALHVYTVTLTSGHCTWLSLVMLSPTLSKGQPGHVSSKSGVYSRWTQRNNTACSHFFCSSCSSSSNISSTGSSRGSSSSTSCRSRNWNSRKARVITKATASQGPLDQFSPRSISTLNTLQILYLILDADRTNHKTHYSSLTVSPN